MKKPSNAVAGPDKGYQAESDLRTLMEAQKIMGDKARMAAAMAKHGEMKGNLDAVQEAAPAPAKKVARPKPTANLGAY
jgi:hypothetical protein